MGILWMFVDQTTKIWNHPPLCHWVRVSWHAYHNSSPQFQNEIPQQREKAAANKTCRESKIIWLENRNCPHLSEGNGPTYLPTIITLLCYLLLVYNSKIWQHNTTFAIVSLSTAAKARYMPPQLPHPATIATSENSCPPHSNRRNSVPTSKTMLF